MASRKIAQAFLTDPKEQFARDVTRGLARSGQKELSSTYLYDDVGSALFEAITHLAEYGLTRADERLLETHADAIVSRLECPVVVAELGSGSGRKTRHILRALRSRQRSVLYYPIDVSFSALADCKQQLSEVASVIPLQGTYFDGLRNAANRRRANQPLLVLFLGSTIGNFDRPGARREFLRKLRDILQPGDALLLGTDLVKEEVRMLDAYDDPTGVTAAFNKNLLARINRELDGDFDLDRFQHEARYNRAAQRIEMHLVSTWKQLVRIPGAGLEVEFRRGETIWTESSHKFKLDDLAGMARTTGFEPLESWVDSEWLFAENLWIAAPIQ